MTRVMNAEFEAWVKKAREVDILKAYDKVCTGKLRRSGREQVGPCPACGGQEKKRSDRFAIKPSEQVFHCRGASTGGDVIAMVMHVARCDFLTACEVLTGEKLPQGKPRPLTPEEISRREAEEAAECAKREAKRLAEEKKTEDTRLRLYDLWCGAARFPGTEVEGYLALRGIRAPLDAPLRFKPDMRFYDEVNGRFAVIHSGPAMFAAIVNAEGRFSGLHITWIDLAQESGKAVIVHPETGELLNAKKVRGVKQGGYIDLVRMLEPQRLITGEGIETVLSAYTDLHEKGRDLSRTCFRCAVDLGNLGGAATETLPHPTDTVTDVRGRVHPVMVPGPEPDRESAAMPVPESADDVVSLGDGDSDPFATRLAHIRFARRWARPGRTIRAAFAPEGKDFNDIRRECVG